MSDNNYKKIGVAPRFHEVLSTGLYTGLVQVAPGTAAALVALVLWYGLYLVLSPAILFWTTLTLIIVVTIVGVWTSNVMEQYWGLGSTSCCNRRICWNMDTTTCSTLWKIYVASGYYWIYLFQDYRHFQAFWMQKNITSNAWWLGCNV